MKTKFTLSTFNLFSAAAFTLVVLITPFGMRTAQAESTVSNSILTTEQLLTRVAIDALCVEYFYLLDHGQAEKLADLFTENGVQDFGGGKQLTGRDAIRKYYAARSKTTITRHVTTNLRLIYENSNRVSGIRTFTHYSGEGPGEPPAIPSVAEYEEIFERGADGQWRFVYRKPISLFSKNK
jgi:uncharacterized protein (TIGR02246 family)